MSVTGLNTTAITNARTASTDLTTAISALTAQNTLYSAALTTLTNSSSANALDVDVVDAYNYMEGLVSQVNAITAQLKIYIGSLAIPT